MLVRQSSTPHGDGMYHSTPTGRVFKGSVLLGMRFVIHGTRDEIVPVWHGQAAGMQGLFLCTIYVLNGNIQSVFGFPVLVFLFFGL